MRARGRGVAQTPHPVVPEDPPPSGAAPALPHRTELQSFSTSWSPPIPTHFFFFSCVLVNQESNSFLL